MIYKPKEDIKLILDGKLIVIPKEQNVLALGENDTSIVFKVRNEQIAIAKERFVKVN